MQHLGIAPIHRHVQNELEGRLAFVVCRQVGSHLPGAVEDHVEGQLLGQGGVDAVTRPGLRKQQVKNTGREIHRPGHHAREGQDRLMLRRVAPIGAPGVVLHAPRPLAGHHVGVSAAQAGILNRLVDVQHNLVFGGQLSHVLVMADHELAVVPFAHHLAGRLVDALDALAGANVASLDQMHAQILVIGKSLRQLGFVVQHRRPGLMVANQCHAQFPAVGGDGGDVEVIVGGGELEILAIAEPIAIPAHIPTLHQHAVEAVAGGEIHVGLGVGGGGPMLRAGAPGVGVQVHAPPDADVFPRPGPTDIRQPVRLIQVEDEVGGEQAGGRIGNLDGAPGAAVRRAGPHQHPIRPGHQVRLEGGVAGDGQGHRGEIDQAGLVDGQEEAVGGGHGHRGVHGPEGGPVEAAEAGLLVEEFVAVVQVGGNPPRLVVAAEDELGAFVHDFKGGQVGLFRPFVAEAQAVVIQAEDDGHLPRFGTAFL